jgi:hypothetical protein
MAAAYLGDTFRAMSRVICLPMLCALHGSALASPRTDPTQGRAVFTGAATASATSIEVNPAALALGLDATEVYLAGTATLDHLGITPRTLDINSGALSDGEPVSANLLSPGGMFALTWHPSNRIALGVAFHSSPAERFIENEQALRYHTLGGSYRTLAPAIATSFRVTSRLHIGIGLAVHTSFLHMKFARDTALAAARDPARGIDSDCNGMPCGVGNPAATELYDVDVRTDFFALDNVVGNVGLVIRLAKEVYLGFAYHTPPGLAVQNQLIGTVEVQRAPRDGGNTIDGGASVYLSQPASVDLELRAMLLSDLDLHVGARLEDLSRMQAYDVRSYGSVLPPAGVPEWQPRPRGFDDVLPVFSLAAWAGVEQAGKESPLALGARIGFETRSLPDERTSPLTIAPTSLTADAGLQYRLTQDTRPRATLQLSYGLQYFPTVDVTDSAFDPRDQLSCADSGYDYSTHACAAVRHGYAIGTGAGEYSRIQQAMRIALRLTW